MFDEDQILVASAELVVDSGPAVLLALHSTSFVNTVRKSRDKAAKLA